MAKRNQTFKISHGGMTLWLALSVGLLVGLLVSPSVCPSPYCSEWGFLDPVGFGWSGAWWRPSGQSSLLFHSSSFSSSASCSSSLSSFSSKSNYSNDLIFGSTLSSLLMHIYIFNIFIPPPLIFSSPHPFSTHLLNSSSSQLLLKMSKNHQGHQKHKKITRVTRVTETKGCFMIINGQMLRRD